MVNFFYILLNAVRKFTHNKISINIRNFSKLFPLERDFSKSLENRIFFVNENKFLFN